ncbi:Uncharacterised protein [Clostridium sporogenes]|uniref:hypothetical protein n=1 Tax=Clostridium sporogenes TaxID=1509 RepID=UPI000D8FADA0|nr:hypothetical protein [Clostridium sporogenes]SQC40059.1 Uncharacterised protein [Clostridium sporogenes]
MKGKKIKTPQVLGLVAIILLIFRVAFRDEFMELMKNLANDLGNFKFIINVFHLLSVMLFITSIIAFIAGLIILIIYKIFDIVDDKTRGSSKWLRNSTNTLHRFSIGSRIAVINVEIWLLVVLGYFYMFNEKYFCRYKRIVLNFITHTNFIVEVLAFMYVITLIIASVKLVYETIYKFLYFQLDEESEKKLHSITN